MSYGKVFETFWTDEKVTGFSDDAKLLALYLLTGPHRNMIGCMRIPDGYVVADLNWSSKRVAETFYELVDRRFIARDDTGWTHIVNQMRYDPFASPNHGRAAIKLSASVPPTKIRVSLLERLIEALSALGDGLGKVVDELREDLSVLRKRFEAPPKIIVTPDPEQEPAPDPEPAQEPAQATARPAREEINRNFEEWYGAYPVHKGRGQAERAYQTARKHADRQALLDGAMRKRNEHEAQPPDQRRFTQHPATWLNGKGWLDEAAPLIATVPQSPQDAQVEAAVANVRRKLAG